MMDVYGQHTIFKKMSLFLAMFSVIFFGTTIYLGWENTDFYRSGNQTIGRIIGFERIYDTNRGIAFYPIVQYKDQLGKVHETASNISTRYTRLYNLGEKYKVVYKPNSPTKMRANSIFGLWGKFIVVAAMTFFNIILYFIFDYYTFITSMKIRTIDRRSIEAPLEKAA
jgi:hypothetical protein